MRSLLEAAYTFKKKFGKSDTPKALGSCSQHVRLHKSPFWRRNEQSLLRGSPGWIMGRYALRTVAGL